MPPPPPPRPQPPKAPNRPTSSSKSSSGAAADPDIFDENHLPSVLRDNLTPAQERDYRRRTCRFIDACCSPSYLRLPRIPVATAHVFFHRFYAKHAFSEHDRFEVAVACVLLAAKTEESPKKLNQVIAECWRVKQKGMSKAAAASSKALAASSSSPAASPRNGGDPNNSSSGLSPGPHAAGLSPSPAAGSIGTGGGNATPGSTSGEGKDPIVLPLDPSTGYPDQKSDEFARLKERVLLLERVLLHTIGFELSVDQPYKEMVDKIKVLNRAKRLEYINSTPPAPPPGAKPLPPAVRMSQELVQNAMNFANDTMHTTLCLQFRPSTIASACVYLSGRACKVRPTGGRSWAELLGIECDDLATVSLQIMELIAETRSKGKAEPSLFGEVRKDLERMREGRRTTATTTVPADGKNNPGAPPPSDRDPKRARH